MRRDVRKPPTAEIPLIPYADLQSQYRAIKPEIDAAIRRASRRRRASVCAVTDISQLLRDRSLQAPCETVVFGILQPDLYEKLLEADARFAAFLPCRVVVCTRMGETSLLASSPLDFCRTLGRGDLENLAQRIRESVVTTGAQIAGPHQYCGWAQM